MNSQTEKERAEVSTAKAADARAAWAAATIGEEAKARWKVWKKADQVAHRARAKAQREKR